MGIHAATARRQFKSRYGKTFVQYVRSHRMGIAFKSIKEGTKVIDTQVSLGYESSSGFHDAFSKIMGPLPKKAVTGKILYTNWLVLLMSSICIYWNL